VVIFSSLTHLSRVGTAVYAADIVKALSRLREADGDSVRGLHGFPVMAWGLQDQSCIPALREIETWLAEPNKRRQHTLHDTSKNFIEHFLMSNTGNNALHEQPSTSTGIHEQAFCTGIELPSSLHSLAKVTIHCLGWTDLPAGLPILTEDEEQKFLTGLLVELNEKLALQLDTSPCTDRSAGSAAESETDSDIVIALAGSSHSSTVKSPNFVTAHYFVTATGNFCEALIGF
jgi:hypothetical protein